MEIYGESYSEYIVNHIVMTPWRTEKMNFSKKMKIIREYGYGHYDISRNH